MKKHFPWLVPPTDADTVELWTNAIFVLDTNVLLHLYQVSQETADDYLQSLDALQHRLWLPNQVVEEYMRLRVAAIELHRQSFDAAEQRVRSWQKSVLNFDDTLRQIRDKNLGLEKATKESLLDHKELEDEVSRFASSVVANIRKHREADRRIDPQSDPVLEKLTTLFDGRIGDPYPQWKAVDLIEEAKRRYQAEIPPGFMDGKGRPRYGDYILWRQILDHASTSQTSVIFVTEERKRDWWDIENGKRVGPHLELRKEFFQATGKRFAQYHAHAFLKQAATRLGVHPRPESIQEEHELGKRREAMNVLEDLTEQQLEAELAVTPTAAPPKMPPHRRMRRSALDRSMTQSRVIERALKSIGGVGSLTSVTEVNDMIRKAGEAALADGPADLLKAAGASNITDLIKDSTALSMATVVDRLHESIGRSVADIASPDQMKTLIDGSAALAASDVTADLLNAAKGSSVADLINDPKGLTAASVAGQVHSALGRSFVDLASIDQLQTLIDSSAALASVNTTADLLRAAGVDTTSSVLGTFEVDEQKED